MISRSTEIVDLSKEKLSSKYAVCYASGSSFKPVKKGSSEFVVERGSRRLVNRTLCVLEHFSSRCRACPLHEGTLRFAPRGTDDNK